jgi:RNA polymerase sigma-70 factor (ECF subfamily)
VSVIVEHYDGLWRFVRRMGLPAHGADDVAQSTFLIAIEALPRILPGRERAFLYATAVRLVYDVRRRAQREVVSADLDMDVSPAPRPDDLAHQKRLREIFEALLERVERDARTVFIGFEVDGFTIPEIAHALAIPPDAATCRLRRARKRLRAIAKDMNMS